MIMYKNLEPALSTARGVLLAYQYNSFRS